jgi:hypothetical protein
MPLNNPWREEPRTHESPALPPAALTMTPPPGYPSTVKEERRCLSEIREKGANVPVNTILSCGIRAVDFAIFYVSQHHLKRKYRSNPSSPK